MIRGSLTLAKYCLASGNCEEWPPSATLVITRHELLPPALEERLEASALRRIDMPLKLSPADFRVLFVLDKEGDPVAPLLILTFVLAALVTIVSAWQLWRAAMAPLDGG